MSRRRALPWLAVLATLGLHWDAGSVDGDEFYTEYDTDWLFVHPEIFRATHHPDDDAWQLVEVPQADGDFLARAPPWRGATLVSPSSGQATTSADEVEVRVGGRGLAAEVRAVGSERGAPCEPDGDVVVTFRCPLSARGAWAIDVTREDRLVGQVLVDRR